MDKKLSKHITSLQSEIASLKQQLQTSLENQNISTLTINKIRQLHKEYEQSYFTALSNHKKHEENLKNQFLTYQSILQSQHKQNEKRLNEEITNLKSIIKTKTDTINQLTIENEELNELITNNKIQFNIKENEYKTSFSLKDKKINEFENQSKVIYNETSDLIKKLNEHIEQFNFKMNRTNSLTSGTEYDYRIASSINNSDINSNNNNEMYK